MGNVEVYIEKYKELEGAVRSTYHLADEDSISYYLTKQDKYRNDRDEIKYCQEIRNLLQHKKKVNNTDLVEPTGEAIAYITSLIARVKNRKKCCDICVDYKNIFRKSYGDKVKDTMRVMHEKAYTCVPIMEGKRVVGAFDANALFEYLAAEGKVEIDEDLTFNDIREYLSIDTRDTEEFLFFGSRKLVDDLEDEFEKSFRRGKRIAAVFLTPYGTRNEDIRGMVTAWDVLGKGND